MSFLKSFLAILIFSSFAPAQSVNDYYYQNEFSGTTPGAMRYGMYGYDNPALLSTLTSPDLLFNWSDRNGWKSIERWGLLAAFPNFSFGVNTANLSGRSINDYKLNFGMGDQSFALGFGFGWSNGDRSFFNRSNLFTAGTLIRPIKYLSAGIIGNFPSHGYREGIAEIAIRPFGNELISIFGDYAFRPSGAPDNLKWSGGAAVELIPGVRITGRYFDNKYIRTGIEFSLGNTTLSTQANFSEDKYGYNTYGIRMGSYDRNLFDFFKKDNSVVEMNLIGGIKYQRFRFLDNSNTLLYMINTLKAAKDDKSVSAIVMNLSGMSINREMTWEIRKEMQALREAGKHIYVYFDRLDMTGYHLASAADKIIVDPVGSLSLDGYIFGKTYFAKSLEKIGIGFHELRYFKYKSAVESFAREEMSAADEEQWQKIVDAYYETAREEISRSRGFTETQFDSLVNNLPLFLPEEAVKYGLADTVARFDKLYDIVNKYEYDKKNFISASSLQEFKKPRDNYWGEKPKIAIIYALGSCAMDEGINARQLVKQVEAALKNDNVKAIVFRVDSPGGDGLASDLVAQKFKDYKYKKPVIVSQGYVAGSGGYWLSMYGDTVVAAPNTITGSIGVISAWVFNKDLKEKLGVSTDFVKRGAHADLQFGMTLPIIGLTLPDRDLTPNEEQKIHENIESTYKDFVSKVAAGRKMKYDQVQDIAQGRVWSGRDGLKNGLVDVLGGLNTAIEIAAEKSGLKKGEYDIIEIPEPGFIDFSMFMPRLLNVDVTSEEPVIKDLKFRIKNMGVPMPIMPFEFSY